MHQRRHSEAGRETKSHSICAALRIEEALLHFPHQWSSSNFAEGVRNGDFCCFHRFLRRCRAHEIISGEKEKALMSSSPAAVSSNSPFCEKGLNRTNEAPKPLRHMDTDAEQLLRSSQKKKRSIGSHRVRRGAALEKLVCIIKAPRT